MDVIAYKSPSIVGLVVYIKASQCIIKGFNKYSISANKTVSEPLADVFYLVALKEWSFKACPHWTKNYLDSMRFECASAECAFNPH